jgi:two-component system LytT family response regulator
LTQLTVVSKSRKIAIKVEQSVLFIDPSEVIAVEAEGNYVLLVLPSESHLVRSSISAVAQKLSSYGFVQIHRSVLVNSSWVREIHPRTAGEYIVRMKSGKEYSISRTYKQNLRSLAGSWIGSDTLFAESPCSAVADELSSRCDRFGNN